MAVAADSHRSFLIPEQYRPFKALMLCAVCPTTNFEDKIQMNCVILLCTKSL